MLIMDNQEQFWVMFWSLIVVLIISIVGMSLVHHSIQDSKITEMIESGKDPIAAMCAVEGRTRSPVCVISAMKEIQ